jgi:hypothetical protein
VRAIFYVLSLAACSKEAPLAEFGETAFVVRIVVENEVSSVSGSVQHIGFGCVKARPDIQASVDGVAAPADPGSCSTAITCTRSGFGRLTTSPSFELESAKLPPVGLSRTKFEVWDASATVLTEVDNPFARRSLKQISPAGAIRRGGEVVLEAMPGTDELDDGFIQLQVGDDCQRVVASSSGEIDGVRSILEVDGPKLRLTLPVDLDAHCSGAGVLLVNGALRARVSRCDGADRCLVMINPGVGYTGSLFAPLQVQVAP